MRFIAAYIAAFVRIAAVLGVVFFLISIFEGKSFLANYFMYVAAVAALGGPIKEAYQK